jgi:methylthioribose-1-phosphate isomerase
MLDVDLTPVAWEGDAVRYLDQRRLPQEIRHERARTAEEIAEAIETLAVRGAPCIGVFAAYGVALLRSSIVDDAEFARAAQRVRDARPTAVNLAWAVDRMLRSSDMPAEARAIHQEQIAMDAAIARSGTELVRHGARVLTHCNTGPLATAGGGTALGVLIAAQRAGRTPHVYACETRPLLQGARLTTLELQHAGVDVTLLADAAAATAMLHEHIDLVLVGADRIAANGDTANKIGTYSLAIAAARQRIPFYVAAPCSTFDLTIAGGAQIPIEQRSALEVATLRGEPIAPAGTRVYNPAFDITPGELITAFITEHGILRPPYADSLRALTRVAT